MSFSASVCDAFGDGRVVRDAQRILQRSEPARSGASFGNRLDANSAA
jgi:hypothetical protein